VASVLPTVAVLTGDLIDSTRAGRDRIDRTMRLLSGDLPDGIRWGWGPSDLRFTRFRGDGWQALLPAPAHALRWAVVLLAALRADPRAIGSRIAIGIGAAPDLGDGDLGDASGPAFEASGRGLDAMTKDERLSLTGGDAAAAAEAAPVRITAAERAVAMLIDERSLRWTPDQAEAAAHFLHPAAPPATGIAQRLGITPQAVGYRLRGAGAKALREALEALEADWARRWETGR